MKRDRVIAELDLKAASPEVWAEIERLRALIPKWRPIEEWQIADGDVLLFFPEIKAGRGTLGPMQKFGKPVEILRQATHWMPKFPPPQS